MPYTHRYCLKSRFMKKEERLNYILEILKLTYISSVQELSQKLNVSHMTIRRDLEELTSQNQIRMRHGSVLLNPDSVPGGNDTPYSLITAESVHIEEKRRIGRLAASLIRPQETLIIDYGSTAEYLAKSLPPEVPLTILTYSLNVVAGLVGNDNYQLIFTGGLFHKNTLSFESPEGLEMIRNFRANTAFVTASGIDSRFGVTCSNYYERPTKRALMQSSRRKILMADSSKFGQIRSDYFADLEEFDEIISDQGLSEEYREIIRGMGISLRLA